MERDVTPPVAGHERAAVSRGQNTILTLPHDATAIRHFLTLLFERLEPVDEPAIRGVVLAADVEAVMAIGRVASTRRRTSSTTTVALDPRRLDTDTVTAGTKASSAADRFRV